MTRPWHITMTRSLMPSNLGQLGGDHDDPDAPLAPGGSSMAWISALAPTSMPRVGSSRIRTFGLAAPATWPAPPSAGCRRSGYRREPNMALHPELSPHDLHQTKQNRKPEAPSLQIAAQNSEPSACEKAPKIISCLSGGISIPVRAPRNVIEEDSDSRPDIPQLLQVPLCPRSVNLMALLYEIFGLLSIASTRGTL